MVLNPRHRKQINEPIYLSSTWVYISARPYTTVKLTFKTIANSNHLGSKIWLQLVLETKYLSLKKKNRIQKMILISFEHLLLSRHQSSRQDIEIRDFVFDLLRVNWSNLIKAHFSTPRWGGWIKFLSWKYFNRLSRSDHHQLSVAILIKTKS